MVADRDGAGARVIKNDRILQRIRRLSQRYGSIFLKLESLIHFDLGLGNLAHVSILLRRYRIQNTLLLKRVILFLQKRYAFPA